VIQPIGANKQAKVDVRVIAATNDDLLGNSSGGEFREDLYHRINEFEILVPPLREGDGDVDVLTEFFVKQANEELDRHVAILDDGVIAVFESYDWPGNLRELRNVVKRMILLTQGDTGKITALPEDVGYSLRNNNWEP